MFGLEPTKSGTFWSFTWEFGHVSFRLFSRKVSNLWEFHLLSKIGLAENLGNHFHVVRKHSQAGIMLDRWEQLVAMFRMGINASRSWMHPLDPNLPPKYWHILAHSKFHSYFPFPGPLSQNINLPTRHLEKRAIVKIRGLQGLVTSFCRFGVLGVGKPRKVAHLIPIFGEGKNDIHQMDSNGLFCFELWNKIQLPLLDFKLKIP